MINVYDESFEKQLNEYLHNKYPVFLYSETDSTNKIAKQLAEQGAKEGTIVLAERQTAGRGRLGRSFFSPEGGIYMSVILRPSVLPQDFLFITVAAAVAVAEAVEEITQKTCKVKWVNDIYINDKKVCGILAEGAFDASGFKYAVLGVGVNLTVPKEGYPAEIIDRADALFGEKAVTADIRAKLISLITHNFFKFYKDIGKRQFVEDYRKRSYLDGQTVEFERDDTLHTAKVVEIDRNAALVVNEKGKIYTINAGDVSVRAVNGESDEER